MDIDTASGDRPVRDESQGANSLLHLIFFVRVCISVVFSQETEIETYSIFWNLQFSAMDTSENLASRVSVGGPLRLAQVLLLIFVLIEFCFSLVLLHQ